MTTEVVSGVANFYGDRVETLLKEKTIYLPLEAQPPTLTHQQQQSLQTSSHLQAAQPSSFHKNQLYYPLFRNNNSGFLATTSHQATATNIMTSHNSVFLSNTSSFTFNTLQESIYNNNIENSNNLITTINTSNQLNLTTIIPQNKNYHDNENKSVLRVVIENMFYQVSLDNLKQIFSKFGTVTKIITFSKNNAFQALIQYTDAPSAQTAKASLNGHCIFPGCCIMRVDYSKLNSLNVRYNNEKSRDYTDHTLPSGDISPVSFGASPVLYHPASLVTAAYTTTVNIPGIGPALAYCPPTHTNLSNFPYNPIAIPSTSPCLPLTSLVGVKLPWSPDQLSTVLLVANLHEELVTPDALFTLFGVYGDVVRVKIMFNKKDNALIQFVDSTQAQLALTHLDKVALWGRIMKVTMSKHLIVQMPKEGQPDSGLTKDYSNSTLHRFKKPNSKNYNNIYAPSCTLHLSNIPPNTSSRQLLHLFGQFGRIEGFKFFETDHKMALIQMASVEEAVVSLIKLHNQQLAETSHLRVSFSKSTIIPPNSDQSLSSTLALTNYNNNQINYNCVYPSNNGIINSVANKFTESEDKRESEPHPYFENNTVKIIREEKELMNERKEDKLSQKIQERQEIKESGDNPENIDNNF